MQTVKCVLVGDCNKSAVLISYTNDSALTDDYVPTVFDNYTTNIKVNNESIRLTLCDTAGQEEYDRLRPLTYPGTDIFLVIFSIKSRSTLCSAQTKWIPEIKHHCPNIPFILVGTESHLRNNEPNSYIISNENCKKIAYKSGAKEYIDCSVKYNIGIKKLF